MISIRRKAPQCLRQAAVLLAVALPGMHVAAQGIPRLDCVINPNQTVELASSVPGVLASIHVEKSEFIEQGEVAATLVADVEQANVVLARARAAIDSEVQGNSVNLDFDQRRKQRMEALYEKKSVSIELKEEAEREHSLSRWRLQQARDLKNVRQLELARAEAQLAQKTIRTPISGFVLERYKAVGEYVEEQPIMRIAQLDPLTVEAQVPIEFRDRVEKGMRARVFPQTLEDRPGQAEVRVIDRTADAASGTFGIALTLANPDYELLGGVKCVVELMD